MAFGDFDYKVSVISNSIEPYWPYDTYTGTSSSNSFAYTYTRTVYMYQVFCPKPKCGQTNWLQLDTIKACTKCGSKLKAVSEEVDYEIPVTKE